ncbi:hypothetical protein BJY04DRAFT_67108 [Aspergillus karnatakaensis]|uniref:uncharacterized protein n=1 Tax=Aspergillus karnatakaensis TaxID=1810916 RepID=UPI003CCD3F81
MTLHNLGDGVHPGDVDALYQHDISMMEEVGPAAEERRRIAREEIQRRRSVLGERQRKRSNSSLGTFDSLVDEDGHLLGSRGQGNPVANSTAVDLGVSQPVQRSKQLGISPSDSTVIYEAEPVIERDELKLPIPTPRSRASSVTAADLTPVSEVSDGMSALLVSRQSIDNQQPRSGSSSDTEGGFSDVVYTHPGPVANDTAEDVRSPFSDLEGLRFAQDRPATPRTSSTADNFSHVAVDASSDGTLSDFEGSIGRAVTPASWSEVGSEVSGDEYHLQGR